MYYRGLIWRTVNITLLACEMSAIVWEVEHLEVLSSHTVEAQLGEFLSITQLACEMSVVVWQSEYSLALPFFGIGVKIDLLEPCDYY